MFRKIALSLLACAFANLAAEGAAKISAQAPVAQINGYASWVMAYVNQQKKSNGLGGNPHLAAGSASIFFTAKGTSANGLEYKFRCAMETAPGGKDGSYFTQNYIEFSDNWGILQVGNLTGANDTLTEDGLSLMGGANSISGTFDSVVNGAAGTVSGTAMYGSTGKATKLVYYTPVFKGFTFGIGYTPNTNNRGFDGKNNSIGSDHPFGNMSGIYPDKQYAAYGLNNVVLCLGYKHDFSTWNMALAAAYAAEKSRRGGYTWAVNPTGANDYDTNLPFFNVGKVKDARAAQFTAAFGFDKWRFATGYINNFKTRLPKTEFNPGNAGRAWNVGGQYTVGAYQFALGYFRTWRELPKISANPAKGYGAVSGKAVSNVVSATVDFNALQGLKFFAELDLFKMNTNANFAKFMGNTKRYTTKKLTPIDKNSGGALMLGTKLSF